ncbi:MAG: transcription antitermination protein NusB [Alcanivorax sp.]
MTSQHETLDQNREFLARLLAAQSFYQILHNQKPMKEVVQEMLERGLQTDDGEDIKVKPNGGLYKKIMFNLDDRLPEVEEILRSYTKDKPLESLLKSIMLCGICEILMHTDTDAPVIINDYLDVTHEFYEKKQVAFVNGVLDAISGVVRAA